MADLCVITDDNRDSNADSIIQSCLDVKNPKSFFLFAGAGSGKTRSLISALTYINSSFGKQLKLSGRKVAVITYTNAARDEIKRRSRFNTLFEISTIHSFAWNLICPHTSDIRDWLKNELQTKIDDLSCKQSANKNKSTKTYLDREKKLSAYKNRLGYLDTVKRFTYNPDGVNTDRDSLDHAEVIKMSSELLTFDNTLQRILVDKYPVLLIDESQDTKKELMDVFLQIQSKYSDCFLLGLFGDMMQRIYLDGKEDLMSAIPENWEKPKKVMNHRSEKRIVDLCNSIRTDVDGIQQVSRQDKQNGIVRVFISNSDDAQSTESKVLNQMVSITLDDNWQMRDNVKCLTIEHKMAAKRLGFASFFEPLYSISSYKQGLLNGKLSAIGVFTHVLIPLHRAYLNNNHLEIMRVIRDNALAFRSKESLTPEVLESVYESVEAINACWTSADPTCKDLLAIIYERKVFSLSEDLLMVMENPPANGDEEYNKYSCLISALDSTFSQVEHYFDYISGVASFDTHQGVKGLEFDRVMVIIDDNSARTTSFSYNKLFGIEDKSSTDVENERNGKETSIDRTKRLFYVTCSRAISSLAIVLYASDPEKARRDILQTCWFSENEILII